ncbi:protein transport protein Sec24-like At4g32640 [Olea europaea var. sylvestris]|uniref:protein transport protein Sec24-like At4g32640 n=1 Tax=Olea europaea var. sylvestris TaxID=158386 RepID=UPI000C1D0BDF|nr:protein transport protein Sec24-like At4g32640 [Olea europaea var. sylvestris]
MAPTSPALVHTGAAEPARSKVDLNHIPRPIPSSIVILLEIRQGNQANPPPPATSDYIIKDTGNCSPRLMRCTINQGCATLLSPASILFPNQLEVLLEECRILTTVVDFWESGPVRCSRCKGS